MNNYIKNYSNDVVVLELGTDGAGQISEFGKYIKLDIAVVTHISEEHMENFKSLQSVAEEELSVQHFADFIAVDCSNMKDFGNILTKDYKTYGAESDASAGFVIEGNNLNIFIGSKIFACQTNLIGNHQMNGLAVATLVGNQLGLDESQIENGVSSVLPMPGRMNLFKGKDGSLIIDDTYNSSPDAVIRAVNYLDSVDRKTKIAVLGNMNEMGEMTGKLHYKIGESVATNNLQEVITIGVDANLYLAKAIETAGHRIQKFDSPYEIGEYLAKKDLRDTVILFKGSQNGVYLEEAVKYILANKADQQNLVRQSKKWLNKKKSSFKA